MTRLGFNPRDERYKQLCERKRESRYNEILQHSEALFNAMVDCAFKMGRPKLEIKGRR